MNQNNNKVVIGIEDLSLKFGGLQALDAVNLEVREGKILAIIGPNGAGKTCVLNCVNGFYHPHRGKILYKGRDLTTLKPHKIAARGKEFYLGLSQVGKRKSYKEVKHYKRRKRWLS